MTEQDDRESLEDDLGTSHSVDAEDQLQPEDTLVGDTDPLDAGYRPPDRLHGSLAWGTTAEEQATDETIEQRIRQELPDPQTSYGAPDNESGQDRPADRLGGDDPDAIPADRDFLGTDGGRVGRLVAPDGGLGEDQDAEAYAEEGSPTSQDTPEEAAMRYQDDEDGPPFPSMV